MIRINLTLDEHTLPRLYQALKQIPPRRRAAYLRTQLSRLEAATGSDSASITSPARKAGIGAGLLHSMTG